MANRKPKPSVRRELLKIDGRAVEITLKLNPRARRLIVKVHPSSGEVSVIAPSHASLERAIKFAHGQAEWIAGQLAHVPAPVALQPNAMVPLRGCEHRIVFVGGRLATRADPQTRSIRVGGRIEHAPRRIVDFLKSEARADLETKALYFAERIKARPRRISLRDTKSRWGSCSAGRHLSFSWRLILAPPFVLDYVVAHEIAHLREMNHSPAFWALVRQLIDDVETPQDWLRRHGARLHAYAVCASGEKGGGA